MMVEMEELHSLKMAVLVVTGERRNSMKVEKFLEVHKMLQGIVGPSKLKRAP